MDFYGDKSQTAGVHEPGSVEDDPQYLYTVISTAMALPAYPSPQDDRQFMFEVPSNFLTNNDYYIETWRSGNATLHIGSQEPFNSEEAGYFPNVKEIDFQINQGVARKYPKDMIAEINTTVLNHARLRYTEIRSYASSRTHQFSYASSEHFPSAAATPVILEPVISRRSQLSLYGAPLGVGFY